MNRQHNSMIGQRIATGFALIALMGWGLMPVASAQGDASGQGKARPASAFANTHGKRASSAKPRTGSAPVIANKRAEFDGPGDEPGARHARWVSAQAKSSSGSHQKP